LTRDASEVYAEIEAYWEAYAERSLDASNGADPLPRLEEEHQAAYGFANQLLAPEGLAGKDVLELGCGVGLDTLTFARASARVTAIDLSPRCVEITRGHLRRYGLTARVQVGNAEALSFPSESFDVVTVRGLLMFTYDPEAVVDEVFRVMKPGGRVQAIVHHRSSWYVVLSRISGARLVDPAGDPVPNRLFTRSQARRLFHRFEGLTIHGDRLPTLRSKRPGWTSQLFNAVVVPLAQRIPRFLLTPIGYYLVVQARKPPSGPNA
jgi:2-polyprenyl-3-methyl-5-hydroxy-6-metoxy-1,4-benzoquinol methylase